LRGVFHDSNVLSENAGYFTDDQISKQWTYVRLGAVFSLEQNKQLFWYLQ